MTPFGRPFKMATLMVAKCRLLAGLLLLELALAGVRAASFVLGPDDPAGIFWRGLLRRTRATRRSYPFPRTLAVLLLIALCAYPACQVLKGIFHTNNVGVELLPGFE